MGKSKIQLMDCRMSYIFPVTNPVNEESLQFRLIDKNYKINKTRTITKPPIQVSLLNFARKNDVNVIYEDKQIPTYLGVYATKINSVMQEFELLTNILKDIDNKLEESKYIETVITARVFLGGDKSNEYLKSFDCENINKFSKMFGIDFSMNNFRIVNKTKDTTSSIHIAPYQENTGYLYIQIAIKNPDFGDSMKFVEKNEQYLNQVLSVMRQDKNE